MATKIRDALCGCCNKDSADVSKDKFPFGKKRTCASVGAQTDNVMCQSYYEMENQQQDRHYDNQYGYHQDYYQDYPHDYPQDYPQDYVDPCAQYYGNQYDSRVGYQSYDGPVSSNYKYENAPGYQFHHDPSMSKQQGYSELGYRKSNDMRCKYDPSSSRFRNYDAEVTRDVDGNIAVGAKVGKSNGNGMNGDKKGGSDSDVSDNDVNGKGSGPGSRLNSKKRGGGSGPLGLGKKGGGSGPLGLGKKGGGSDPSEPSTKGAGKRGGGSGHSGFTRKSLGKRGKPSGPAGPPEPTTSDTDQQGGPPGPSGPTGLTRTATIMRTNMSPFPNHGPFSLNSRPHSALPYYRSPYGAYPSSNGHDFGHGNYPGSSRRRATDPGNLHSQSMMETRDRRSHTTGTPFPRPPVSTYMMPQANYSETPFDLLPRKGPSDIWQNNNNPHAYLFGWGKKKVAKNKGDGSNKLKMLYQINNAGVTCNCGQRMQFNLSVEENAGRCVACFEELRQDFADLLDLYKEMGYSQCDCKGRISVTDLANEYLMDQANNASGRGYENVGAPRKKGPVKTIELTPTEGFTGCICREIKMEMFRKPSDLLSCQCDTERPKIVLLPPSDDEEYEDDYGEDDESVLESDHESEEPEIEEPEIEEPERDESPEYEVYVASEPSSRTGSALTTPTNGSVETVLSMFEPKSSAFIERRGRKSFNQPSSSKQSNSSNSATFETATSDSSVQSNKTYIIPI